MVSTAFPPQKLRQYQDYQEQIFQNVKMYLCSKPFTTKSQNTSKSLFNISTNEGKKKAKY